MAENNAEGWQRKLLNKKASLFIIGHEHFNKSLTLDIENRLMNYMLSVDSVKSVHNSRANPQFDYYPVEELDEIFNKIWMKLHKEKKLPFIITQNIGEVIENPKEIFKGSKETFREHYYKLSSRYIRV